MKKLLTLLLLATLCVACSSDDDPKSETFVWNGDWNDPKDPNYKPEGYNPIEGEWQSDSNPNFKKRFTSSFEHIIIRYVNDTWKEGDPAPYIINNTGMKIANPGGQWSSSEYYIYQEGSVTKLKSRTIPLSGEYKEWTFYTKVIE